MKTLLYAVSAVIFSLSAATNISAQAQSVASKDLTWQSSELTDKSNSKRLQQPHRLEIHKKSYMELHRGSEQTLRFDINSVSGNWMDEKADGSLIYNVTWSNSVPGVVTVTRSGTAITAHIDFTETNKNGLHIELIVTAQ
ncbi:MAG TPA: hypothetical protein VK658_01015 [Chryseolinea sp.]|nr:hypothetical protein [Chryseolinea sp.]